MHPSTATRHSPLLASPIRSSFQHIIENNRSVGYLIARVLQAILPKAWFCWVSRGTIQFQSVLRPHRWSYWTKISDDIYLGAMPLKNWNHLDQIANLGIKAILAMNEDSEFHNQLFAEPVQRCDWEKRKINFLKISTPDLEPIGVVKLAHAVNYVANQVSSGHPVYIGCTGGRGRSACVAICSLVQIKGYTLEEAVKHVKRCRPQVMLSRQQIEAMLAWHQHSSGSKNYSSAFT